MKLIVILGQNEDEKLVNKKNNLKFNFLLTIGL